MQFKDNATAKTVNAVQAREGSFLLKERAQLGDWLVTFPDGSQKLVRSLAFHTGFTFASTKPAPPAQPAPAAKPDPAATQLPAAKS